MTSDPIAPSDLEAEITAVYRGPLEDFIGRRDALAKQLRASKRRDDADRVKALRKPSLVAWALDQVVVEDAASIERLAGAILGAQEAHANAAGAREAQEDVRAAVRAVAEAGARAASRGGHPIESTELVAAVRAVIGEADAFAAFRAGRLVGVPEGGGLDLLAAMSLGAAPPAAVTEPASKKGKRQDEAAREPGKKPGKPEDDTAATRAALQSAEASLTRARDRVRAAERAVLSAQARVEAAEEQLQRAQEHVESRRAELERAREEAGTAAAAVDDAERGLADIQARLG